MISFLKVNELCFIYDIEDIENTQIEFKPILAKQNIQFIENYFNLSEKSSIDKIKAALNELLRSSATY